MGSGKKSVLVVNVLFWVVAALLHPLARLLPTNSGEPPKIYSLLIPLAFIGLAYGSTLLMWRAIATNGTTKPAAQDNAADGDGGA
jgi:hypothetical protein